MTVNVPYVSDAGKDFLYPREECMRNCVLAKMLFTNPASVVLCWFNDCFYCYLKIAGTAMAKMTLPIL
jgi:hypothetical protein